MYPLFFVELQGISPIIKTTFLPCFHLFLLAFQGTFILVFALVTHF